MSNYKTVFFTLGILQIILGISMVFPIIIQIIFDELDSSFIGASLITIIFGTLFFLSNLDHDKKLSLQNAFLLTALSWLSIAVFSSLPFIFSNLNLSITDSFFESMSGITTTGSTIITDLNSSPKAILLWRALLQWLGGIGIIVMAITLMPIMNVGGMQLFKVSSSDASEKILPKTKEITLRLILIYLILTFLCSFFYNIFGMEFFDSLTHSMTTIATGGFSNYNESIGYFNNIKIEIISMVFIILGSIPFISYIKFLSGKKNIFYTDTQIKSFIKIIFYSIVILFFYLTIFNKSFSDVSLRSISFNVISILTGTGYVTQNFDDWGSFPLIYFLILMFIGGCAGSTACGIKIFRVQILYLFLKNQLKKIIYPRGIFIIKYDNNNVNEKFMASIIAFIYLYIIIFFIITTMLSLSGLDFTTSISGAATSISNVGPGLGELIGPNNDPGATFDTTCPWRCIGGNTSFSDQDCEEDDAGIYTAVGHAQYDGWCHADSDSPAVIIPTTSSYCCEWETDFEEYEDGQFLYGTCKEYNDGFDGIQKNTSKKISFDNNNLNNSLFFKSQIILYENPKEVDQGYIDTIDYTNTAIIISHTNLTSGSRIKKYFDTHKFYILNILYHLQ